MNCFDQTIVSRINSLGSLLITIFLILIWTCLQMIWRMSDSNSNNHSCALFLQVAYNVFNLGSSLSEAEMACFDGMGWDGEGNEGGGR